MILLDLSQVVISNLMVYLTMPKSVETVLGDQENFIRHMVLNSIRSYRKKFSQEYGEIVICCDDRHVWRREVFPQYKAHRRKDREASTIDWTAVFDSMNKIRNELEEYMPYKIIQSKGAEADDIIASICHKYGEFIRSSSEKILILSGDKDFLQLQKYANVYQYSPVQKKWLTTPNPERFLREHIMLGDRGDGVPNFLSDDDTFTNNKRQKNLSRIKLETWCVLKAEEFCNDTMLQGYKRNETLINLDMIPKIMQESIIDTYERFITKERSIILSYLMNNRLKSLTEKLGDF